ncbi:hypothetical protein SODALDRAFT_328275 [Sodiomyces alkalinus F11]|uniref:RecQ-mediated genome instability protein 1 n=1 Tax=Sodiomyces alkalinus (strain CBS 110278 / VKM F-3762 / F11) TaxID=1314773 RepID=A0A3N2PNG5_SODAK|nr:hypothetical protein SODALDRAFT_328275 [Sodiomyces alkalinus F11]ROT35886.1 hypothetical protein SODALDRAFT_328275 [Sodiomyces alkalinus F11]
MDLPTQLRLALQSSHYPVPSQTWLTALATSRTPPPPFQSLLATAKARLLAADLTTPGLVDPAHATPLPENISDPNVPERTLTGNVHVQVVDIENLARSRWEQVEELEALERGEGTRGREIIRLPAPGQGDDDDDGVNGGADLGDEAESQGLAAHAQRTASRTTSGGGGGGGGGGSGSNATAPGGKKATHRLVLQDHAGRTAYAIELKRVDRIGVGVTGIGEKMMLRSGTAVARGVVLLEPDNCVVLGGKIDAWQKPWLEGRLKRLREAVENRPSPT